MDILLSGLRAAAEPSRLRLLALCAHAELTVSELVQIIGQSQPRVSRHLKLLCEAGLLDRFREGTWAFYRLSEKGRGADLARVLIDLIPEDDGTLTLDLQRLEAVKKSNSNRAAEYFRQNAESWDKIRSLHIAEDAVENALRDLFPASGIKDFLDIGTGTGRVLELFGPQIERGVGIDMSREMLAVARANLQKADLRNCQVRQGDMYQLPFSDDSFDGVVIHQVLHFAEDPAEVIAEAARALRPGGRLVVVDFAPHHQEMLREEHAHRRLGFNDSEVARWFGLAGLSSEKTVMLEGEPLTVCLWSATRAANDSMAPVAKDEEERV
ncbi:MAG: metalloregulator ArsR/SmtB family transcription factor [Alphaproteobacteria bacterium]|nr:metalloregulator ArsR/SmtB family transcription factor [Alphaproteobacteria bacterium]